MSLEAIEVLQRVRVRAASKEWCKSLYWAKDLYGIERSCIHQMAADEVRKANRSGYPTPLDGEVFHALWDALPSYGPYRHTLPSFNDAWETTQEDVVKVVDKALEKVFWSSTLRFLAPEE